MHRRAEVLRRGRAFTLFAARTSQALAIVVLDRLARNNVTGDPSPLGRLWAAQLNLAEILLGEPVGLTDEGYQHIQRLVELHREFVQRLFEAFDTRDLLTSPVASNVIHMTPRLG